MLYNFKCFNFCGLQLFVVIPRIHLKTSLFFVKGEGKGMKLFVGINFMTMLANYKLFAQGIVRSATFILA